MPHTFDYSRSTAALTLDLATLFAPPSGFIVSNDLFRSDGVETGTLRYVDAATGQWVTETTWMNTQGQIGTGTPTGLYFRDQPGITVPAAFDRGDDFTAIGGEPAGDDGYVSYYLRFAGIDSPQLHWDNTAENADEATARAEFAANLLAARTDYLAQINAVLTSTVTGAIDFLNWGADPEDRANVLHFTSQAGSGLTYGDILGVFQLGDGQTVVGPTTPGGPDPADMFGAGDAVEITLSRQDDVLTGDAFGAASLNIDAGQGDDSLRLFYDDDDVLPGTVIVTGGLGDDEIEIGAFMDTQVYGGNGQDIIDLTYGRGEAAETDHILYGGDGRDGIYGTELGAHWMSGDGGKDYLFGGSRADTMYGGTGKDQLFGDGGDDDLAGDDGDDVISAGEGQDTLVGGAGKDVLNGEAGLDVFVFGADSGRDTIEGYEAGEAIQIDASYWSGSVADFVAARVGLDGDGTLTIRLGDGDRIKVLSGTSLDPADFIDVITFV